MSATQGIDADPSDANKNTLGALLYADKSKTRVSEEEWVALVRAIAAGDQLALRALYERTYRLTYTLIMRITSNPHTAEELTVDVFHDVWRRASGYDAADGTVLGWIMNQARSRAIDRIRFEQRKKRVHPSSDELAAATEIDFTAEVAIGEQARRLRDALALLSLTEREAIETAFFSELTYAETATRLNQPLGTIKTRIRTGLAKLRHALTATEQGKGK